MELELDEVMEEPETEAAENSTETVRKRKRSSPIWAYFKKCEDTFAECLVCGAKYQHSNNTSNLAKVLSKFC